MKIQTIPCGPMGVNTFVLSQEGSSICAVIDPADAGLIWEYLQRNALQCTHILLTHGHFDHILGVTELQQLTGAQVYIHENDADMLYGSPESLAALFGVSITPLKSKEVRINDGDVIRVGDMQIEVIHTPGHTMGGVSFLLREENVLFTGDTLFRLSVGRYDFSNSDEQALYHSILVRLFTLPGDYRVLTGHERETTLDFERKHNPVLLQKRTLKW